MHAPDVLTSPRVLRAFHGWATVGWLAMIPISLLTGLKNSVPFLVGISVWALVAGHWASWQATRAEQATEQDPR